MDGKLILLVVAVGLCAAARIPEHEEARAVSSFGRRIRGYLDCKNENDACYSFPPCCGDLVCFWENGWSARRPGKCVSCVDRSQVCQRDAQCCEGLVCQKETTFSTNGICDVKLPLGAECHDNDQCESEHCKIHWYNDVVMGHGGRCAEPGTP